MIYILKITKIVFINLFIFLCLIGLLTIGPITYDKLRTHYYKFRAFLDTGDYKWNLPNYDQYDWSEINFKEYRELATSYYDYIVWRRNEFKGETININNNGIRKTNLSSEIDLNSKNYIFFGGSTMWGSGVSDEYTIPSIVSSDHKVKTINYGESGYIARQSLSMLNNLYINNKLEFGSNVIVFYDGANDVFDRCRVENKGVGSVREEQIRKKMNSKFLNFDYVIQPFLSLINKIKTDDINQDHMFVCDQNPERVNEIVSTLIETWRLANIIAKNNGDKFIAILQPVAFIGDPFIDHLPLVQFKQNEFKKQFETVYPILQKEIKQIEDFTVLDFTHIYDREFGDEHIYQDFCHSSPQGHYRFSEAFGKYIIN